MRNNTKHLPQTAGKWLCRALISCLLFLPVLAQSRGAQTRDTPPLARSLAQQYQRLADARQPLYLTPDVAFERAGLLYADTLATLENESLAPQLGLTLAALQRAVRDNIAVAVTEANAAPLVAALRDNEAYLETASRLLGQRESWLERAREEQIQAELRLVNNARGLARSPLLGYLEDYSQYTPRGPYAANETLRRYFRAVTWLGRLGFYTAAHPSAGVSEAKAQELTTRAVTLFTILAQTADAQAALSGFEDTLQTLYGPGDDLAGDEALRAIERATGHNLAYMKLSDALAGTETARARINTQARRPRLNSTLTHEGEAPPLSLKLIAQRFAFDSQVYQSLTFNNVQDYQGTGQPFTLAVTANGRRVRGLPRGLDVLAALGSDAAAREINAAGDADYLGYDTQLQQLRAQAQIHVSHRDSFYTAYLRAVQAAGRNGNAESQRRVNTALGGYILLRHSSIAYAKQSYTVLGKGLGGWPADEPDAPQLMVAPEAEVFTALAEAVERLTPQLEGTRNRMLLAQSRQLSSWLQLAASQAGRGPVAPGVAGRMWRTMQEWGRGDSETARVTDVHTDLNSNEVLQLGVGAPQVISRAVNGAQAYAAVFSCYEFRQSLSRRLSDEEWRNTLTRRPEFVRPFYAAPAVR